MTSGPAPMRVPARIFDPEGSPAEIVRTHVSTLAFFDDVVHKRKNPVHFGFIDLSSARHREQLCHREVELNRRFSPDVYLGVEEVVDDDGHVVDHAVVMRRMPAARRLATLVRRGEDVSRCLERIAAVMAEFHRTATRSAEISAVGTQSWLHDLWERSLTEIESLRPSGDSLAVVEEIRALAHSYLDGRGPLLAGRIAEGRIVDGHGDLLAEDVFCLSDGPRILDCLEFDDQLRWGDVINDVGFLAMDLEHLGREDLARMFMNRYRASSGETHPPSLEDHYVAYRALVRAKVSFLQGSPDDDVHASSYLALCVRRLRRGRVRLVLVGGLPGTGKSTLARALHDRLGWPVLRSDVVRKQLVGLDPSDHRPSEYGQELYSPDSIDRTYVALGGQAAELLGRGESVIVDASYGSGRHRHDAAAVARAADAELVELECTLPAAVAAGRVQDRNVTGEDPSDADPAIAAAMARRFDPWLTAAAIDTRPPVDDVVAAAIERIAGTFSG